MKYINLLMTDDLSYESESRDFILSREYGKNSDGNDFSGAWVLRDAHRKFIDADKNRHELAERHNMSLWPTK
jgi:hypothetical protein